MKINLEKLSKLELRYGNSHVTTNTLQTMLDLVLNSFDNSVLGINNKVAYTTAITTLTDLDILEIELSSTTDPKKQG
jgi:hypothetical protein